jgi:type IV secretion system protein VirB6
MSQNPLIIFQQSVAAKGDAFTSSIMGLSSGATQFVVPIIMSCYATYIIWYGYLILQGEVQEPIKPLMMRSIKIMIILGVCLGVGGGSNQVNETIWELSSVMSSIYSPSGSTNPLGSVTFLFDKAWDAMVKLNNLFTSSEAFSSTTTVFGVSISLPDVSAVLLYVLAVIVLSLVAIVFLLFTLGISLFVTIEYYQIQFALAFILSFSPFFIGALCFDKTARYFDTWLAQALNYCFHSAILCAVTGFIAAVLVDILNTFVDFFGPLTIDQIIPSIVHIFAYTLVYVVAAVFGVLLIFKSGQMASGMIGGSSLESAGQSVINAARNVAQIKMGGGKNKSNSVENKS